MTSPQTVTAIRVRYAETDRMGVAHHAAWLPWLELARTDLLRAAGHPYRELEDSGVALPVVEVRCRYRASARYDDVVRVTCHIERIGSRSVVFAYRLACDDVRLGEATTAHVCVGPDGTPRRLPPDLRDALEALRERGDATPNDTRADAPGPARDDAEDGTTR